MAKTNPEAKNKAPNNTGPIPEGEWDRWLVYAKDLNPKLAREAEKNPDAEWQLNELATAMMTACGLMAEHWPKFQKIIAKTEKKAGTFSLSIDVMRANTPSEVDAKISYSEKYSETVKRKVKDPAQGELSIVEPEDEEK